MAQESAPTHILTTMSPFIRFTDARIGRAYRQAVEALHGDMVIARYEPSDICEEALRALATTIQLVLEEEADVQIAKEEARAIVEMTGNSSGKSEADEDDGLVFPTEEKDEDEDD